jgi:hypothetical protein
MPNIPDDVFTEPEDFSPDTLEHVPAGLNRGGRVGDSQEG